MRTRHPSGRPRPGSAPAAETVVPPQAASPEQGPPAERLAYSVDEAARLTGLSRDLLYDEMRRGHLDYLKVGRRRLITRQHLEQFLAITPRPQPADGTAGSRKAADDAR
jgi:excisionase family DNA binding protein